MSKDRPNIILMVMDATRPDHLSCYGHRRRTTPQVDRVAAEGVLYEQAISPAIWTLPAFASLFTGLYVSQHGTHFQHQYLDPSFTTLAEMLRARGYRTAGFSQAAWISRTFGFHRGFETFRLVKRLFEGLSSVFQRETLLERILRHLLETHYPMTHRTNQLIRQWFAHQHNDESPFFLFVLYTDPHLPYRFHEPFASCYLGERLAQARRVNQDPHKYMAGKVDMTVDDFDALRALYDVQLSFLDARIGELLDWLREMEVLDDTLLIVTADHGENHGDHGLMAHQYCVYETLIRVPLIIRHPGLFPAGQRVAGLVQTSEVFTTVMSILGIQDDEIPNDVRGRSLVPQEVAVKPLPFAVAEYLAPNMRRMLRKWPDVDYSRHDRRQRAIRRNRYKYIWSSDGQEELYDLRADPHELNSLMESDPQKAQEHRAQLEEWLTSIEQPHPTEELTPDMEHVIRERLERLGYL